MAKLIVGAVDPAFENWGMAKLSLDTDTWTYEVIDLKLIVTKRDNAKQQRRNSDDLRRAKEIDRAFQEFMAGTRMIFSEIPSGAQHARAAFSFGIVVGILAGAPAPLIQVTPLEIKMAATGDKGATKPQMIKWATKKFPDAPWLRARGKATGEIIAANEHLADALGAAEAGLLTEEFGRVMAFFADRAAA